MMASILTLGKNNQVHLEREFCPHVLEVVREFFNNLNSALDKKKPALSQAENSIICMRETMQKEVKPVSRNEPKQPTTALIRHGAYLLALVAILWFLGRYILPIIWALIERI